ncbi:hypothetical protein niasHT_017313 [Heterodera trifolii]|uniref:Cytosolic purine 5'-nucleotidase n=1 Tax=Heterodera trifolii TaxID=157864 RepID=A0ABD2L3Y9_9BILA
MNSSAAINGNPSMSVPFHLQKQISIINKREPEKRIFVNRTVRLEKIQLFGFDMDYTLAEYKSPIMEAETFKFCIDYLIRIGYPTEIAEFEYDPMFSIRGLWFDIKFGNLLKVDGFGNILRASHGRRFLTWKEVEDCYPNKFVQLSERQIYVLNTLFNLPDAYLITRLVDFFDKFEQTPDRTGVRYGDVTMSYNAIYQDIRAAMDHVHGGISVGQLKKKILTRIGDFVEKDERIGVLLAQLRATGRKTFLLTNSDYEYTKGIMTFLLGPEWCSFFDMIIVDACKPLWFGEGTVFREVDTETGALKIGVPTNPLKKTGAVYSGGSCEAFRRLLNVRGKEVLYIGDHIFGDVLRSKKTKGWHTFLVVPELSRELAVWTGKRELFERLQQLESELAELYRNLDANTRDKPTEAVTGTVFKAIQAFTQSMEQQYGVFGSLFRSGTRTSFFASQVERYADLYAGSCFNLVHYPVFYFFRAPMALMPHESTVDHGAAIPDRGSRQNMDAAGGSACAAGVWSQQIMSTAPNDSIEEEEEDGSDSASASAAATATPASGGSSSLSSPTAGGSGAAGVSSNLSASSSITTTAAAAAAAATNSASNDAGDGASSEEHNNNNTNNNNGVVRQEMRSRSGTAGQSDVIVPKQAFVEGRQMQ